jgi:hypothetical protein
LRARARQGRGENRIARDDDLGRGFDRPLVAKLGRGRQDQPDFRLCVERPPFPTGDLELPLPDRQAEERIAPAE